jgi:sugar phosphate isomerase/epimerase
VTTPGIPSEFALSTTCFGTRLASIQDQIFAAVGMGFRRIELGLTAAPPLMEGLVESQRETGVSIPSLIAGCRDSLNGSMVVDHLGSLELEVRERALIAVRRHVRLARSWGCHTIVVRGSKIEDEAFVVEARELEERCVERGENGNHSRLRDDVQSFVSRVAIGGHRQVQEFCRSLHTLMQQEPGITFALEPGREIDDLFGFDVMGWVIDDLGGRGLAYWHDVGHIHMRETLGLPPQGQWLDAYGSHMLGIHLQDAAEQETEMPVGRGGVDFALLREYVPPGAERVVEIGPRHGRAEILNSVRALVDLGF